MRRMPRVDTRINARTPDECGHSVPDQVTEPAEDALIATHTHCTPGDRANCRYGSGF